MSLRLRLVRCFHGLKSKSCTDTALNSELHTSTHPDLTRIPIKQAEGEIRESRMEIQDRLGAEVETFAYPYGSFNANVKDLSSENSTRPARRDSEETSRVMILTR